MLTKESHSCSGRVLKVIYLASDWVCQCGWIVIPIQSSTRLLSARYFKKFCQLDWNKIWHM